MDAIQYFRYVINFLLILLITSCSGPDLSIPKNGDWKHVTERPYIDRGNLYVPQLHYDYDEVGYASWYGEQFNNRKTALGQTFKMNGISGAHRTLPLPTVAKVTNLENGRSIVVVINDRGPFYHVSGSTKRIIDLSKGAARALGFLNQGRTKVRVQALKNPTIRLATSMGRKNYSDYPANYHDNLTDVPNIPVRYARSDIRKQRSNIKYVSKRFSPKGSNSGKKLPQHKKNALQKRSNLCKNVQSKNRQVKLSTKEKLDNFIKKLAYAKNIIFN